MQKGVGTESMTDLGNPKPETLIPGATKVQKDLLLKGTDKGPCAGSFMTPSILYRGSYGIQVYKGASAVFQQPYPYPWGSASTRITYIGVLELEAMFIKQEMRGKERWRGI